MQHHLRTFPAITTPTPGIEVHRIERADQTRGIGLHAPQLPKVDQEVVESSPGIDGSHRLLPEVVGVDDGHVDAVLADVARDLPQVAVSLGPV